MRTKSVEKINQRIAHLHHKIILLDKEIKRIYTVLNWKLGEELVKEILKSTRSTKQVKK